MSGRSFSTVLLLAVFLLLAACQKPTGKVCFTFSFSVDTDELMQDTMLYVNAAGNRYEVTEVQYFISNVVLTAGDGTSYSVKSDRSAHYVDADLPYTLIWKPEEDFPVGSYSSITFVFGLAPEWNISYCYPDAPENNMSWPSSLGGGYHNMKINGRWIGEDGAEHPFNLHSGRVLTTQGDTLENSFSVTLPLDHFEIVKGDAANLNLKMNINRWFCNPNVFDLNEYGGSIMQNAAAQAIIRENGHDVFSVGL